jgi:uncharacterized membrane protein
MRNFVTVVFDDKRKAYKGLHALWELDDVEEITVHGTAVVHRDEWGYFEVDTKETHPVFATAVGIGIGALLGVLAGPAGVAIGAAGGAAIGAAGGAAIGAATGAVVGGAVDVARSDTRQQEASRRGSFLVAVNPLSSPTSVKTGLRISIRGCKALAEQCIGVPRAVWRTIQGTTTGSTRTMTICTPTNLSRAGMLHIMVGEAS